jgi:hypothetical protein
MKGTTKNTTTAHARGNDKGRLKRLLREMAWNDWSTPLKGLINCRGTTAAHRRMIK